MTDPSTDTRNFGGIPSRSGGDPAVSEVVFVPAPYEGTVSYGAGTARGPEAILEASRQVETWDDETGIDLEQLSYGWAPAVAPGDADPAEYSRRVQEAVAPVVARGAVPFVLGGEHSVSIGAMRAVRAVHPRMHVLSIDAHADLRDEYEGSDHSHACVMRRAVSEGSKVTIVGVRSYSAAEARFAAGNRQVRLVPARDVGGARVPLDELVSSLGDPLYVTFDVDGLDPAVVGATGTPEPGGLAWDDALALLREVFRRRRVVGLDVVELAPGGDSRASEFATARLVAKMLTYRSEMPMKGA